MNVFKVYFLITLPYVYLTVVIIFMTIFIKVEVYYSNKFHDFTTNIVLFIYFNVSRTLLVVNL